MLSYVNGNPWAWRKQMQIACNLYAGDNLERFDEGATQWAIAQGIYLDRDHIGAYRASLEKKGKEPLVPHHWRKYTAHLLGLKISSGPILPSRLNADSDDMESTTPRPEVIDAKRLKPVYYRVSAQVR